LIVREKGKKWGKKRGGGTGPFKSELELRWEWVGANHSRSAGRAKREGGQGGTRERERKLG